MNWKFWKLDWFGQKAIAELRERVSTLEKEVDPTKSYSVMQALMMRDLFGSSEDKKPLRLHRKVEMLAEFVGAEFHREPQKYEIRKAKKARTR